ncbi:MAG: hypothetical protein Q9165_006779 [Trypethelium subeluteriae]
MDQRGWPATAYNGPWPDLDYSEQATMDSRKTAYAGGSFPSASGDIPSDGICVNPADLTQPDSAYDTQPSENNQYINYPRMEYSQVPNLEIAPEQASIFVHPHNVQAPLSDNTASALVAAERSRKGQRKRGRDKTNTTEDRSERPRAGKRPKAPQETPAPSDRDLIRCCLAYHRSQSPNARASEFTIEQVEYLSRFMQKSFNHVAQVVRSELCFDRGIQHEPLTPVLPFVRSGHVLAQKYADKASENKCEKTRSCEGRFQCIFKDCCYQTDKVDSLKRHLDVRRPSTVYVCEECLKQSDGDPFMHQRKDKFRHHLKNCHEMTKYGLIERSSTFHPDAKKAVCGFCSEEFRNLLGWRDHVIDHFKAGDLDHGGKLWDVREDWKISEAGENEDENQSASDSEQLHGDDDSDEYDEHEDDDNGDHTDHDASGNSHNDATGPSGGSSGSYQPGKSTTRHGHASTHYPGSYAGQSYALSTGGSGTESLSALDTIFVHSSLSYQNHITYIDHLGRGANGSVDKVKNTITGETYARKSVRIKKRGAAVEASFKREIHILRTRTHPSIPRFIDVYRDGSTLNVLMEPAADLNLKQYLENPWKVRSCTQDVLNWLRDITAGVAALHAPDSNNMSIRHGDIKPSNILVALSHTEPNVSTKLILIDFGASRAVPANDSESSSNCAKTPMYAAPEINEKERHGRRADIFSLGCVLVELLTFHLTGSVEEFMSRLQFSSKESRPYSEKLDELEDWLDGLKKQAEPTVLHIIDICRMMLRRYANERPTAEVISGILACTPYPDSWKQSDSYSWLDGCRDSKAEDIVEEDSNLLEATHNPGGGSPQVDLTSSSDDEFVLPDRTAQGIDEEIDETIRQKVVHQSSDYGQDPRVRALLPTSNLERMQSPQRTEVMTNSLENMAEELHPLICLLPGCGQSVKDLEAHMLTHHAERSEKCPGPRRTSSDQPYSQYHGYRRLSVASMDSCGSHATHENPDEEGKEKGLCPIPECGRVFEDLKAHMLTHQTARPEKCPIPICEYHQKGFTSKYDKNRHTLTHYKGTMVCGFCPGRGSAAEKRFNRADVFKRHLVSVHGLEQIPSNSTRKSRTASKKSYGGSHNTIDLGTCSTCSGAFVNAQKFYEHLDDCVLRVVMQQDGPSEGINQCVLAPIAATADTLVSAQDLTAGIDYQVSKTNANSERSTPKPEKWRVLYAYEPKQDEVNVLRLRAGDIISVIKRSPSGWWDGVLNDGSVRGWFPSTHCAPFIPPLDLVVSDGTLDDTLASLSEEERAAEGWEQLGTYPIAQALSLGSDIDHSGALGYLLCPHADTASRINAALMLFMNTRWTVEQLMSLPHLYRHDIGEICVELRALENTLAELVTVFERRDGSSNYIEPLRPDILTQTGICLRSIVSLRKILFGHERDPEGEACFKIEQSSDRKVIASCKKDVRMSTQALDGTLSRYRSRALGLVFRNRTDQANAETGNNQSGSVQECRSRPLLLEGTRSQSPEPISTNESPGPLDLGLSRKQLTLRTSQLSPATSIDRFSQSSRVSTTSSILSSDDFSSFSRTSFASSATSVSTYSSSPRKSSTLNSGASPKNTLNKSLASTVTGSWDYKLCRYCSALRILPPLYSRIQNGPAIAWSVIVKDRMVNETSPWYANSEEAKEEAAKLALEKLTRTMRISTKAEEPAKLPMSYDNWRSSGDETLSQRFAGKCSPTGFWGWKPPIR